MPQLIVRNVEERLVRKLKERAGRHGVSMEEEHRRILRESLLSRSGSSATFEDALLEMPNVGVDEDFACTRDLPRRVDL
jgi:plasmid stability protein